MKHTSGQIKTTPAGKIANMKPMGGKKKMPIKVVRKKKFARAQLPNIKGAETKAKMNSKTGINEEMNARKMLRQKQGL